MGAIDHLPPPLKRHRLRADDYRRLGRSGAFGPDLRVELLVGQIIEMAPIGTRHWAMVNRLDLLLKQTLGKRAIVPSQSSFRLDEHSEPQPDLALFKWRDDFYVAALPTPADTLLVFEVADSTLRYDSEVKLPRYARQAVPEVWIVDLESNLLHMHRDPRGEGNLRCVVSAAPGIVELTALPGASIDLIGIFG